MIRLGIVALATCICVSTAAQANELPSEVTIWHSAPAGSPVDAISRVVGRHIGRFLPGAPSTEVQSIPGAGGLNLLRRLDREGRTDGGVLGMASMSLILSNRMDPDTGVAPGFHLIGSLVQTPGACIARRDLEIRDFSEFLTRGLRLGAASPLSSTYREAAAIRGVFDAEFQIVVGLQGPAEAFMAMRRGEIDGACGIALYTIMNHPIAEILDFVGYLGATPAPDFVDRAGVAISDLVEDPDLREALEFISLNRLGVYSFWLHEETPGDIVAAYDNAFQALVEDPEFVAEITPIIQVLLPSSRAELNDLIERIRTTPQPVVDLAVELVR